MSASPLGRPGSRRSGLAIASCMAGLVGPGMAQPAAPHACLSMIETGVHGTGAVRETVKTCLSNEGASERFMKGRCDGRTRPEILTAHGLPAAADTQVAACPRNAAAACLIARDGRDGLVREYYYAPMSQTAAQTLDRACTGIYSTGAQVAYPTGPKAHMAPGSTTPLVKDPPGFPEETRSVISLAAALVDALDRNDLRQAAGYFSPFVAGTNNSEANVPESLRFELWKRSMRGKASNHRIVNFEFGRSAHPERRDPFVSFSIDIESDAEKHVGWDGSARPTTLSKIMVRRETTSGTQLVTLFQVVQ